MWTGGSHSEGCLPVDGHHNDHIGDASGDQSPSNIGSGGRVCVSPTPCDKPRGESHAVTQSPHGEGSSACCNGALVIASSFRRAYTGPSSCRATLPSDGAGRTNSRQDQYSRKISVGSVKTLRVSDQSTTEIEIESGVEPKCYDVSRAESEVSSSGVTDSDSGFGPGLAQFPAGLSRVNVTDFQSCELLDTHSGNSNPQSGDFLPFKPDSFRQGRFSAFSCVSDRSRDRFIPRAHSIETDTRTYSPGGRNGYSHRTVVSSRTCGLTRARTIETDSHVFNSSLDGYHTAGIDASTGCVITSADTFETIAHVHSHDSGLNQSGDIDTPSSCDIQGSSLSATVGDTDRCSVNFPSRREESSDDEAELHSNHHNTQICELPPPVFTDNGARVTIPRANTIDTDTFHPSQGIVRACPNVLDSSSGRRIAAANSIEVDSCAWKPSATSGLTSVQTVLGTVSASDGHGKPLLSCDTGDISTASIETCGIKPEPLITQHHRGGPHSTFSGSSGRGDSAGGLLTRSNAVEEDEDDDPPSTQLRHVSKSSSPSVSNKVSLTRAKTVATGGDTRPQNHSSPLISQRANSCNQSLRRARTVHLTDSDIRYSRFSSEDCGVSGSTIDRPVLATNFLPGPPSSTPGPDHSFSRRDRNSAFSRNSLSGPQSTDERRDCSSYRQGGTAHFYRHSRHQRPDRPLLSAEKDINDSPSSLDSTAGTETDSCENSWENSPIKDTPKKFTDQFVKYGQDRAPVNTDSHSTARESELRENTRDTNSEQGTVREVNTSRTNSDTPKQRNQPCGNRNRHVADFQIHRQDSASEPATVSHTSTNSLAVPNTTRIDSYPPLQDSVLRTNPESSGKPSLDRGSAGSATPGSSKDNGYSSSSQDSAEQGILLHRSSSRQRPLSYPSDTASCGGARLSRTPVSRLQDTDRNSRDRGYPNLAGTKLGSYPVRRPGREVESLTGGHYQSSSERDHRTAQAGSRGVSLTTKDPNNRQDSLRGSRFVSPSSRRFEQTHSLPDTHSPMRLEDCSDRKFSPIVRSAEATGVAQSSTNLPKRSFASPCPSPHSSQKSVTVEQSLSDRHRSHWTMKPEGRSVRTLKTEALVHHNSAPHTSGGVAEMDSPDELLGRYPSKLLPLSTLK